MTNNHLEVLGIGALQDRSFLVYFSDQTYATVSAEKLAECFPERQEIPESVTEAIFASPGYHASRNADGGRRLRTIQ